MKKIFQKWIVKTIAVIALAFMWSCNSEKEKENKNESTLSEQQMMDKSSQTKEEAIKNEQIPTQQLVAGDTMDFRQQTPEKFKQQLNAVLQPYLRLKNALIEADVKEAREASSHMMTALMKVDDQLLTGVPATFWKEKKDFMHQHILLSKDAEDIKGKRENFAFLSQALVKAVEAFGVKHQQDLYVQYCPMANDGRGSYWLSEIKKIKNPFFGEQMLSCGETKHVLQ